MIANRLAPILPDAPPSDADALLADGLMTVPDAAAFLGLGVRSLYGAMERGELPYAKFGRARRIPRRALLDFAASAMQGGWAARNSQLGGRAEVVQPQDVATA